MGREAYPRSVQSSMDDTFAREKPSTPQEARIDKMSNYASEELHRLLSGKNISPEEKASIRAMLKAKMEDDEKVRIRKLVIEILGELR